MSAFYLWDGMKSNTGVGPLAFPLSHVPESCQHPGTLENADCSPAQALGCLKSDAVSGSPLVTAMCSGVRGTGFMGTKNLGILGAFGPDRFWQTFHILVETET